MSPDTGISVVIITLNETHDIGRCLASVRGIASEIVVVDSGSTDGTQAICRQFGARVIETDWPGFGPQKQRACDAASMPWILSLDADEALPPALAEEIAEAVTSGDHDGYLLPRRSQFLGRWVRFCGWTPDHVLRLFRRERGRFSQDLVHEKVELQGRIGRLHTPLDHYSYRDREEVEDKIARYAEAGARDMLRHGRSATLAGALASGLWAWLRTCLLRGGFLDGVTGLRIATMNARCTYRKYALLRRYRAIAPTN